jgi:hypothetical protein
VTQKSVSGLPNKLMAMKELRGMFIISMGPVRLGKPFLPPLIGSGSTIYGERQTLKMQVSTLLEK